MNGSDLRMVCVHGCAAVAILVLGALPASAQVYNANPYRHTYDPEHGYVPYAPHYGAGAYGGYYGGMSPGVGAGAAAAGFGQAAAGVGQMHESNAQAEDIHQQAVNQYLKNYGLAEQTRIQTSSERDEITQQRNQAQMAAGRAQVALYKKSLEQMSAAHRLTASQFDFSNNVLHWPFALRGPQYADLRLKIDQLYDARTPDDSGTDSSGFAGIQEACDQMNAIVKTEVQKGMPISEFVTAKHFISSIEYEARFKVKPAK